MAMREVISWIDELDELEDLSKDELIKFIRTKDKELRKLYPEYEDFRYTFKVIHYHEYSSAEIEVSAVKK